MPVLVKSDIASGYAITRKFGQQSDEVKQVKRMIRLNNRQFSADAITSEFDGTLKYHPFDIL
jgi:hypothetical protein